MGKGQAYERKVCRQLSLWVSGGKRKDYFWRTAGSGAAATVNRAAHQSHVGDVCCTHAGGQSFLDRFVVECKHGKKGYINVDLLVYGRKAPVEQYWKKLVGECARGQEPFLLVRENGRDELLMTTDEGLATLVTARGGGGLEILFSIPRLCLNAVRYKDVLKTKWRLR